MSNTYGTGDVMSPSAYGERSSIWWLAIVRGIFAIIFGILALTWPAETAVILTLVFAVYAIVDGIVNIVGAIATRKEDSTWGWLLAQGILTLIVGVLAIFAPLYAASFVVLFVLWVIAIWAVIGGIFGIPAAASLGASGGAKAARHHPRDPRHHPGNRADRGPRHEPGERPRAASCGWSVGTRSSPVW